MQDNNLNLISVNQLPSQLVFSVPANELLYETETNPTIFRINFKHRNIEFVNFLSQFLGWKPTISHNQMEFQFTTDLERDIILYGIN